MADTDPRVEAAKVLDEHWATRTSLAADGAQWCAGCLAPVADSLAQHQADMLAAAGLLTTPDHDREIAARALREAAEALDRMIGDTGPGNRSTGYGRGGLDVIAQIRNRADRIEAGEVGDRG